MAEFSGHLSLQAARRSDGRTIIAAQSFRAPYHVSKPYWDPSSNTLLVQVVNPTAGILSGDRLESEITVEGGASLLVTTPSASRVFRMNGGEAHSSQRFSVSEAGSLEVMPEPLVPHRGSTYFQHTAIEVGKGGTLYFVDQLAAGRIAHGEAWSWNRFCLTTEVRLSGELVLRERFDQNGKELGELAQLCGSGAGACFANAVLITEHSAGESSWRSAVAALHSEGLWVGVSALRRGGWSVKVIASDSVALRRCLREIRRILSEEFPQLACDPRKL